MLLPILEGKISEIKMRYPEDELEIRANKINNISFLIVKFDGLVVECIILCDENDVRGYK